MAHKSLCLIKFTERLEPNLAFTFIKRSNELLDRPPVIEGRFFEISKKFGWLINPSARAVERLLTLRHTNSLDSNCISIIAKIPPFKDRDYFEDRSLTVGISTLSKNWRELNFTIFWKDIELTRKNKYLKKDEKITYFWQAYSLRNFWNFEKDDFEHATSEIIEKHLIDDKLVALSLSFQIYKENDRPRKWREQLKKLTKDNNELSARLADLLRPPAQSVEQKKWKLEEAKWKRKEKVRNANRLRHHAKWLEWLSSNFGKLKDKDLLREIAAKDEVLNAQNYLLSRMRKLRKDSTHWTQGNWRDLIAEFGEQIAESFRDGLIYSWRLYRPSLLSENNNNDGTPISTIIGLSGLEIESREVSGWTEQLSTEDVNLACRYAFQELNGFPNWFPTLHKKSPKIVVDYVLAEIQWELEIAQDGQEAHYIIDKTSCNAQTLWDDLAPKLLKKLETDPKSLKHLNQLLKIVQSSSTVSDQEIIQLAKDKCETSKNKKHVALWLATWIGVEPDTAIQSLSKHLEEARDDSEATEFAMHVIVNLIGSSRRDSYSRTNYNSPKHLQDLYVLMHKYIKVEDDIDRMGKGVYTPQLRDNAQEARNGLLSALKEIPGKDTYLALIQLAKKHPKESFRAWIMHSARERAEKDADLKAMTRKEFNNIKDLFHNPPADWSRFIEMKPNFFGLGLNLNEAWISFKKKLKL